MPTVLCSNCGKKVTFEGVAGVCPHCASVVRPPASVDAAKAIASAPRPLPKRAVKLSDIAEVGGDEPEEVFEPGAIPTGGDGRMDPGVLYAIVGVVLVVLVFTLYVIFSSSSSKNLATAPPPPPVVLPAPPSPRVVVAAPEPEPVALVAVPTTRAVLSGGPAWARLKPVKVAMIPEGGVSDDAVGKSLRLAVDWLVSQYFNGTLIPQGDSEHAVGADALCTYALLHAGATINDTRLGVAAPFMISALDHLRELDLNLTFNATYSRSLRASALALADRPQDRSVLSGDLQWLIKAASKGSYYYGLPPKDTKPEDAQWDNSNSQYGVLGVWAAAQAGLPVSLDYWRDVEAHWLKTQNTDGSWNYNGGAGSLTMTSAGVTMLSVAAEHQVILNTGKREAMPLSSALARGISWLSSGETIVNDSVNGYTLYGIERAALATGLKRFGNHDWYRELSARILTSQNADGSWDGNWGNRVQTAFRILFLARGRQALAINKLRFIGEWNHRPRDASKLAEFATHQLEQPFAWGVADFSRDWNEWIDCPLLLISTDTPPAWSDEDFAKLRKYTDAGGMIFLHSEQPSPEMDDFAAMLAQKAFGDLPFADLQPNHHVYSTVYPLKTRTPLRGVSDGVRLLMVYSPRDITRGWVTRRGKETNESSQLGLNLFVYAAGKTNFRGRLVTPYLPPPSFAPLGSIPVVRIQYSGKWDAAPGAWVRFPRWFQNQTRLGVTVQNKPIAELNYPAAPVAVLSGFNAVDFSAMDLRPLHDFVAEGGIVLIDAVGGSKDFIKSVREQLLPKAFADGQIQPLSATHPILAGTGEGMDPLPKPRLRPYAMELLQHTAPPLDVVTLGKGVVIISDIDLTTGLLDASTWGIVGYEPAYANSLVKNLLLWASQRYHL